MKVYQELFIGVILFSQEDIVRTSFEIGDLDSVNDNDNVKPMPDFPNLFN